MIPSAFVLLERLPLARTGKLDLRALPPPESGRMTLDEPYVAPRTATEETVADIWSELLGVKQAGVHDNFFELGGHSLLAIQVLSRIRQSFQVDLPVTVLFEHPSIAQLASAIEEALAAEIDALTEDEAQNIAQSS
ncbi:MAG: hypothetical protein HY735_05665 [Verrucomicrobia bacterium]|nr:hypothetical protein [Verrucomicrobiota bacterium]